MIGIDTNVLARFLLVDDTAQAKRARNLILKQATVEEPAFISTVVMAELFWLLDRGYKLTRKEICLLLDGVLTKAEFEFESMEAVLYAFNVYRTGRGDFSDALLGRIGRLAGCQHTYTFDKGATKLDDFAAT